MSVYVSTPDYCFKCAKMEKQLSATVLLCHQDDVALNTFLERFRATERLNTKSEVATTICEFCYLDRPENKTDKYCIDCSKCICLECLKSHVENEVSKAHKIVDKNSGEKSAIKLPESSCDEHKPSVVIDCKKCEKITCLTCCMICHCNDEKLGVAVSELNSDIKNKMNARIIKVKNPSWSISSVCVLENNILVSNNANGLIESYDMETGNYKSSFLFHRITNVFFSKVKQVKMFNVKNDVFFYYKKFYPKKGYPHKTVIFKLGEGKCLDGMSKKFFKLTNLIYDCDITSTFKHTLLVKSEGGVLIELDEYGEEENDMLGIPRTALFPCPANVSPVPFSVAYQLSDTLYVVMAFDDKFAQVVLFDKERTSLKTHKFEATADIGFCTDFKKFVFVLEKKVGKITVLSIELEVLHEFTCPGVENICYDAVNDIILLIKESEIIYFTYRFGSTLLE